MCAARSYQTRSLDVTAYLPDTNPIVMRILLFTFIVLLVACNPSAPTRIPKPAANTQTYVPIYLPSQQAKLVVYQPPKPIVKSGKIYTIGNYLLQVETDSGIHVIDYSIRTAPKKVGFIKSMFCTEMAVKGNFLYINNLSDLVVLDISNISNPVEVKRVADAFPFKYVEFPPVQNRFFECPDPAKGIVIGWKVELRNYPECYR